MSDPLVVFIPEKYREELEHGGVLPPTWFRDAADLPPGGSGGERVWLWTEPPPSEDELRTTGAAPLHPARLLGLPCKTDAERELSERRVAKLFGAWVAHFVFLESGSGTQAGRTGIRAVRQCAEWTRRLKESIRYWFSDEQARNIRHLAVVIATGGAVDVSEDDIRALEKELGDEGAFQALYFADHRIETERENDSLHMSCLWPVVTGRLLLRFLVALGKKDPEKEDLFASGAHLWKSGELLFEYPMEALSQKLKEDLPRLYGKLSGERDGGGEESPKVPAQPWVPLPPVFPDLTANLSECAKPEGGEFTGADWHAENVEDIAKKRQDDSRWDKARNAARAEFAEVERKEFAGGGTNGRVEDFDPVTEFTKVAENPRGIEAQCDRVTSPGPDVASGDVYAAWLVVVSAEVERRKKQKCLIEAAAELAKAQKRYVTPSYGVAAPVAVSLAGGYPAFWALMALGGDAAWFLAVVCAGLVAGGAFFAWWKMTRVHRQAGRTAFAEFAELAEAVDKAMDSRHQKETETVKQAEEVHRGLLRAGAQASLARLLLRVRQILRHELESPPLDATWRQEEAEDAGMGEESPEKQEKRREREERATYLALSRWTEKVEEHGHSCRAEVMRLLEEVGREVKNPAVAVPESQSFAAFWHNLCSRVETDKLRKGNLPAQEIIPAIRRWIENLTGRLLDAQQRDFRNELAQTTGPHHDALLPQDGKRAVEKQDPFTWASASLTDEHVRMTSEHLYVFRKTTPDGREQLPGRVGTAGCVDVPEMSGLPQAALYFRDILLHGFKRENEGQLAFRSKYDEREGEEKA